MPNTNNGQQHAEPAKFENSLIISGLSTHFIKWVGSFFLSTLVHSWFIANTATQANKDTFYNLTLIGRVSLVMLSIFLITLLIWVADRKTAFIIRTLQRFGKANAWLVDLITTIIIFALSLFFAPQIYYTLYLLLFDGLDVQWVLPSVTDMIDTLGFILFQHTATYSGILKGITVWTLLFAATWTHFGTSRKQS